MSTDVDLLIVRGLPDGNVATINATNTLIKAMSLLEEHGTLVKLITLLLSWKDAIVYECISFAFLYSLVEKKWPRS